MEDLIGYAEFLELCNVEDPLDWVPCTEVRPDGVWIVPPDDCLILTSAERATPSKHPKRDLSIPALRFPCSFAEFKEFLDWLGGGLPVYVREDALSHFRDALATAPVPVKEYLKTARANKIKNEIIAHELKNTYRWTYLKIARELKIDHDLQPNQIDAVKQRARRLCIAGEKIKSQRDKLITSS